MASVIPVWDFVPVPMVNTELPFLITQALAQNRKDVHDLIRPRFMRPE